MSTTYRIAEVAERSGFTPATLRYYEEIGLVQPAGRTEAGYRLYDDASLQRLRFIARAKQLGCSLDEIADLSPAWDGGHCARVQERLRAVVEAKASESRRQIAELVALTADLQRAAARLVESPTGACNDTCGCLTDTSPTTSTTSTAPTGPTSPTTSSSQPIPLSAFGAGQAGAPCGDAGCGCGEGAAGAEPPIACTLEVGQVGTRVQEWEAVLEASDDGQRGVVARTSIDGGVRLQFGPGTDVAEVARLAAAEQDCCRFFRFGLSIDTAGVALEVRAPDEAIDIVTALFGAPT